MRRRNLRIIFGFFKFLLPAGNKSLGMMGADVNIKGFQDEESFEPN